MSRTQESPGADREATATAARRSRPETSVSAQMMALQRTAGNAAVARSVEEERHQHGAGCGHGESVQRSAVPDVLRSAGKPLDDSTRSDMESRLGADFSDVRIHDNAAAKASAAEVGARAYTSGSHVVIGDGGADKHTLAHELTHVIQQRQGPVAGTDNGSGLKVSDPTDRFEREAEANATRAMNGPAPVQRAEDEGAGPTGPVQGRAVQRMAASMKDRLRTAFMTAFDADPHTTFDSVYWDFATAQGMSQSVATNAAGSARTVFDGVVSERADAAAAAQAEVDARRANTRPNARDSWVMAEDVHFMAGTSRADLKDTTYEQLKNNQIRANGVGKVRFEPELNMRCHVHGLTDSQGISFAYVLEADYRVRVYVYDVADKRVNGNQYEWRRGGKEYTSSAEIPGYEEAVARGNALSR
ncbi:DUF4157 domain-containing protein [Streptomyces sp. NPDC050504]|uniref:DUF4157 domain-containing protein n=1 Tax=Streptomyces sp. NPDC050504 TaxID=3365618 RepID=UPI0037B8071C